MNGRQFTDKQQEVVMSSPALKERAKDYPKHWRGQVPALVDMLTTVQSELPPCLGARQAIEGETYPVWVNSHGAVSAVFPDGNKLGLKPTEFVVVKFHATGRGEA
jgi:hypothetical protein